MCKIWNNVFLFKWRWSLSVDSTFLPTKFITHLFTNIFIYFIAAEIILIWKISHKWITWEKWNIGFVVRLLIYFDLPFCRTMVFIPARTHLVILNMQKSEIAKKCSLGIIIFCWIWGHEKPFCERGSQK